MTGAEERGGLASVVATSSSVAHVPHACVVAQQPRVEKGTPTLPSVKRMKRGPDHTSLPAMRH